MRRMRSILAVALLAAAAPAVFAVEGQTAPIEGAAAVTTQQLGEAAQTVNEGAAAINQAIDGAQLPAMDADDIKDATNAVTGAAAGAADALPKVVTTEVPADAVVINLTPNKNGQDGCYTIGEPNTPLADFCKTAGAAAGEKVTIGGVDYEWVTGSLKNVGGKDICAFSAAPLKLATPMQDMLKIVEDDVSKHFEQVTLPETKLFNLRLPDEQTINVQLLMPVDVSAITEAKPLAIPGTTLSANLQPCELIDGLAKPDQISKFQESLSKLAEPAAAAEVAKAAEDATAAVTDAAATATDAAATATTDATTVTDVAGATTKAADAVADAAAKAGEALKPQGEGVGTEAISPANSLTASLAGLAAVAAALAFQFVL